MKPARPQGARRGYALVTAIVFLVLLTLVAIAAIRGTGLEVKSTANHTLRAEAFAASEIARTVTSRQIAALCDHGPAALPSVAGWTRLDGTDWCSEPKALDVNAFTVDARYRLDDPIRAHGEVSVQRLYAAAAAGAGQAQGAGYAAAGIGAATGGGHIYFMVQSRGIDRAVGDTPEARYTTASVYRYVIRR